MATSETVQTVCARCGSQIAVALGEESEFREILSRMIAKGVICERCSRPVGVLQAHYDTLKGKISGTTKAAVAVPVQAATAPVVSESANMTDRVRVEKQNAEDSRAVSANQRRANVNAQPKSEGVSHTL